LSTRIQLLTFLEIEATSFTDGCVPNGLVVADDLSILEFNRDWWWLREIFLEKGREMSSRGGLDKT
jgi:hypothetical protein